ncbi:MAG: hypothetical protein ACR2KV_14355 [Solirubrobacteraceae bacterium]
MARILRRRRERKPRITVEEHDPREWPSPDEAEAEAARLNAREPREPVRSLKAQRFWVAEPSDGGTWHVQALRDRGSWRSGVADTLLEMIASG